MLCHDSEGSGHGRGLLTNDRQLARAGPHRGSEGPIVKKLSLDCSWGEEVLLHATSDMMGSTLSTLFCRAC